MPCAKPLQKLSRAKLTLLVGATVQASARSPADLILMLTAAGIGGLAGGAAYIRETLPMARQNIGMRISRTVRLLAFYRMIIVIG
jgi:hypothetical protein